MSLITLFDYCHRVAWKPQHGTNKEVWSAIVEKFNAQKGITGFQTDISWESAKDQLIALLDRQRRQKKKGNFAAKLDGLNARIDGQPPAEEQTPDGKRRSSLEDDRPVKFPRKSMPNSSIILETSEPMSGYQSVDIGTCCTYRQEHAVLESM